VISAQEDQDAVFAHRDADGSGKIVFLYCAGGPFVIVAQEYRGRAPNHRLNPVAISIVGKGCRCSDTYIGKLVFSIIGVVVGRSYISLSHVAVVIVREGPTISRGRGHGMRMAGAVGVSDNAGFAEQVTDR